MVGVIIELAVSGRARCRACGKAIMKGLVRMGEQVPNPFGEGETTYWFHPQCAAYRRPELFSETTVLPPEVVDHEKLLTIAAEGKTFYRLARIAGAQRSPSGRALCRHCRKTIEKGSWRIVLEIWNDSRFNPMGFLHVACSRDYFGVENVIDRVDHMSEALSDTEQAEISELLAS